MRHMKLGFEIEKTMGTRHHHPSSRRTRRTLDCIDWEKWPNAAGRIPFPDRQPDCCTHSIGYSDDLMALFGRASAVSPSISIDPDIMEGQPCISGTRIPVRAVLRAIEYYESLDGAIRCYPHLTKSQVKDALYFSQVLLEPQSGIDEASTAA